MENINTITKITSKKNNIVLHINNNTYPIDSYYYECILPYVGKVLEVSESRISQLHGKANHRLRAKLTNIRKGIM